MSGNESSPEANSGVSRLDKTLLLASFVITETAGAVTNDDSTARYVLLGVAAAAFIKGVAGFISIESAQDSLEPDPKVLQQHNSFGEL